MSICCHSAEEIERAANRLPCVPTDNEAALIALGFEPMYPQENSGYYSHLWSRVVDARVAPNGQRSLIIQRAYLERTRLHPHPRP